MDYGAPRIVNNNFFLGRVDNLHVGEMDAYVTWFDIFWRCTYRECYEVSWAKYEDVRCKLNE